MPIRAHDILRYSLIIIFSVLIFVIMSKIFWVSWAQRRWWFFGVVGAAARRGGNGQAAYLLVAMPDHRMAKIHFTNWLTSSHRIPKLIMCTRRLHCPCHFGAAAATVVIVIAPRLYRPHTIAMACTCFFSSAMFTAASMKISTHQFGDTHTHARAIDISITISILYYISFGVIDFI